jgi:hypothetical protein
MTAPGTIDRGFTVYVCDIKPNPATNLYYNYAKKSFELYLGTTLTNSNGVEMKLRKKIVLKILNKSVQKLFLSYLNFKVLILYNLVSCW